MNHPLRVAVIGMGGFAATHHDAVLNLEKEGVCRLVCTCDPAMDRFGERREALAFRKRDVRLFPDYLEMLDTCRDQLDVVTIPTPVPLHAPMHRACVDRGLAVYLEKPPTLNAAELDEMLAVEQRAVRETMVGFNFIVESQRQALKRRLVADEFGALRLVTIFGHWPRGADYYQRAAWAGRLVLDDTLVLDSPMGNALAHLVHNGLFWGGTRECFDWGTVAWVEAELYRAHPIQGTDTVFVRAGLDGGPELRVVMTHACASQAEHYERVVCDAAELTYIAGRRQDNDRAIKIERRHEPAEYLATDPKVSPTLNLRTYFAYLRGDAPRPMTRLADSRPFVELNGLAYLASGRITTLPARYCTKHDGGYLSVNGLYEAMREFAASGVFPSAQGQPWAVAGGRAVRADLSQLTEKIHRMSDRTQT